MLYIIILSLIFYTASPLQVMGKLELIPADYEWETCYTLDMLPLYHGIQTQNLFAVTQQS